MKSSGEYIQSMKTDTIIHKMEGIDWIFGEGTKRRKQRKNNVLEEVLVGIDCIDLLKIRK